MESTVRQPTRLEFWRACARDAGEHARRGRARACRVASRAGPRRSAPGARWPPWIGGRAQRASPPAGWAAGARHRRDGASCAARSPHSLTPSSTFGPRRDARPARPGVALAPAALAFTGATCVSRVTYCFLRRGGEASAPTTRSLAAPAYRARHVLRRRNRTPRQRRSAVLGIA